MIAIDKIDQLMTRIEMCYDYYIEGLEDFDKAQIIEMAGKISAVKDAYVYLTENHTFDYEEADQLLRFKDPLEIVADIWEERISDTSDMSFDFAYMFSKNDPEQDGYELMGGDAPAAELLKAEAKTGNADIKNITLLKRRLNEHEFYKAINKLLPDHSPLALDCWTKYANSKEYDGMKPAIEMFKDLIAAFTLVKEQYGAEIATQTFHIALEVPISTDKIRIAAYHLNDGMDIDKVFIDVFEGKLKIPSEVRVKAEAERIVAEFSGLTEPNSPAKTHFMVKISHDFLFDAGSKDQEKLFDALPYKTRSVSNLKGEKGLFVFVKKEELQKEAPTAEQLKDAARVEAQRLIKELKALDKPNDPFTNGYTARISDAFMKLASFDYNKLLFETFANPLPMTFGNKQGEKGSFITVSNSVRKELSVTKEKSSILGQLADAQKEAAAQAQPPGTDKGIKKNREEL